MTGFSLGALTVGLIWLTVTGSLTAEDCSLPLGLAHRNTIKDAQFSASSSRKGHLPWEGRLGNQYRGWCGENASTDSLWIEISFSKFMVLTHLEIEGIQDGLQDYFVKTFRLQFSYDGLTWYRYPKLIPGNSQAVGVKAVYLDYSVKAKHLRLHPEDCHGRCCVKLEAYGCQNDITPELVVEQSVQKLTRGGDLSVTCNAKGQPGVNVKLLVMENGRKTDVLKTGHAIHSVTNDTRGRDLIMVERMVELKITYAVTPILALFSCEPVGTSYEMRGFNCSGRYFCEAGYEDANLGGSVEKEFVVVLKDFITLPRPPIVTTINPSSRSVFVKWKIPFLGDIPITKYEILFKLKSTRGLVFEDGPTVGAERNSATLSRLAPYTDYNVMIVALLPDDVKRFLATRSGKIQSSIFRFKTDVAGPSASPLNVEIVTFTSRTIELAWQEPPTTSWNGPLDGYGVFYTRTNYGGTRLKSEPRRSQLSTGQSLTISLQNLIPWSSYVIELYAFNIREDGSSVLGVMKNVTVQTNVDAPSKAPVGLSFLSSDSESASLQWQPPPLVSANGPIDGYYITFTKILIGNLPVENPKVMEQRVNRTDVGGYTLRGLDSWCTYRLKVAAYNEFRGRPLMSPQSPQLEAVTQVNEPTVSSRNLTATRVLSRSVMLAWSPPPPQAANGPIDGYIAYYRQLKMGPQPLSNLRFRTKPVQRFDHSGYLLDGLLPWSTYDVRLSAYNSLGDRYLYSREKESIRIETNVDRPASPPENLQNITVGSNYVELTWKDPPMTHRNGPLDGYRLHLQRTRIGPYETLARGEDTLDLNRTVTSQAWLVPHLSPWTTYSIRVSAFNRRGKEKLLSPPSNNIEIVTKMDRPTGSPTEVAVAITSATSFSVSWEEPALEEQNGVIEGYLVRLNSSSNGSNRVRRSIKAPQIIRIAGDKRSHALKDLDADTTYSVEMACYTGAGLGPFGAPLYVKTKEGAPSAPLNPRIMTDSGTVKWIAWDSPLEPNGHVRKYEVELLQLGVNASTRMVVDGDTMVLNITQLERDSGYLFRVRGVTVGPGAWSSWKTLVELPPNSAERRDDEADKKRFVMIIVLTCLVFILLCLIVTVIVRRRRLLKSHSMAKKGLADNELALLAGEQGVADTPEESGIDGEGESCASHSTDSLQNEVKTDKLDTNPPSAISSDPRHPPIPAAKFPSHALFLKEDNKKKLREEFKEFKVGQVYSWDVALTDENRWKNRYANIVAYDHSRVLLKPTSMMPGATDYINATYIDSYSRAKAYIATQGPLDSTSMDFWQMVWNEKATVIVALTRLEEGGKNKCHQYWPSDIDTEFLQGDIQVSLLSIDQTADYVINSFEVKKEGMAESRLVYHFHFLSWPDHGTPDYPVALLSLRRRVRHHMSPKVPLIVHCSAGVGRSGCFILVDAMLEKIAKEKDPTVDVYNYMHFLRSRRINMVQTEEQYGFVHDAIAEAMTCGNTEIPLDELPKVMKKFRETSSLGEKSTFEKEYLRLTQYCPEVRPEQCTGALKPNNIKKNRNLNVLPKDAVRVYLAPQTDDCDSGYINAVHADGYRERNLFILAEAPMKHTISTFWQMVEEKQCNTIVMLNCLREFSEVYPRIWPMEESNAVEEFGRYGVEMLSEQMDGDILSRRLRLLSTQGDFEPREVQLYQYLAWPHRDIPESRRDILHLISRVEASQRRLGNQPIVVMCSDGAGRSGTFVSIYNSIERVKVEQLIDVFQCARALRLSRQTAVATSDQYTFIYDMVMEYLDSFDTYANFH